MIQKVSSLRDKLERRLVKLSDLNPPNELISPAQSPIHARASRPPQKPPFPARTAPLKFPPKSTPLAPPKSTPFPAPSEPGPKRTQNPGLRPPSWGRPDPRGRPGSPSTPVLIIQGLKACALIIRRVSLEGRGRAAPSVSTERAGPTFPTSLPLRTFHSPQGSGTRTAFSLRFSRRSNFAFRLPCLSASASASDVARSGGDWSRVVSLE